MRLQSKNIVITGATGIGASAARMCAAEGANVFVVSIDGGECEVLAAEIKAVGGSVEWAAADLTDETQTVNAFAEAASRLGAIDGLYAVAGGSGRRFGDGALDEISKEAWDATFSINGHPAFLAAREALKSMLASERRSSIALVSSVLAYSPSPLMFTTHAYAAVKGAEISLAKSMAAQYAPHGIRVNVVAPGLVHTPMAARAAGDPEIVAFAERKQPLVAGMLDPDDLAPLAVFLMSDESRAITGQTIAVDGGWSVTDAR